MVFNRLFRKKSLSYFLDWVFPPLCLACREFSDSKHLCSDCWKLFAPPDPAERCRHCFSENESQKEICAVCRKEPLLPIARAFVFDAQAPLWALRLDPEQKGKIWASFALNQWVRLEWPQPDAIVPMPDPDSEAIGKEFSKLLQVPFYNILKVSEGALELRDNLLKEGAEILMIEAGNPLSRLQKGVLALSEAFPKKSYLLSLYP